MSSSSTVLPELAGRGSQGWPMEIRALLDSLQTQSYVRKCRRGDPRRPYQVQAILWFKGANNQPQQTTVYTRDVTSKALAFMSQQYLKVGQSIILEIPASDGGQRIQGHIRRCRQFREGWFECLLEFPTAKKK